MNHYPAPIFDALTFYGMLVLTLAVSLRGVIVFCGDDKAFRKWVGLMLAGVLALSAGLATLGMFARRDLFAPPFQLLMLALLVASIGLGFRPLGRRLAQQSSLDHLVLLQAFRLPLEILMFRAADQGMMPMEFSFVGYNFDIITGASALILGLALVLKRAVPRWVVVVWNLWGIACLAVIALLATLMSPNIAAFGDDPSKILFWVLYFPYSWLPHVLVIIAVLGHVLVTLKLREIAKL